MKYISKRSHILIILLAVGLTTSVISLRNLVFADTENSRSNKLNPSSSTQQEVAIEVTEAAGSVALPPSIKLKNLTVQNLPASAEDVRKTFDGTRALQAMNRALDLLNAGVYSNLGVKQVELSQGDLKSYNQVVQDYTNKIQKAGKEDLNEKEVTGLLLEFKNWCATYKQSVAGDLSVLSSPVDFNVPHLKEEYLTYEPYTAITAQGTPHYKLRTLAKSTSDGYRTYDGAILVALGSAYGTQIGTIYNITFSSGKTMKAILGDNKSDTDTDPLHQYRDSSGSYDGSSGNIVEILFDLSAYSDLGSAAQMYAVNAKINKDYPGRVTSIQKIGVSNAF